MSEMKNLNEIGNIKELRTKAGLSQETASRYCGVSIYTYQKWERGITKKVKKEWFDKLKKTLNVS